MVLMSKGWAHGTILISFRRRSPSAEPFNAVFALLEMIRASKALLGQNPDPDTLAIKKTLATLRSSQPGPVTSLDERAYGGTMPVPHWR